MAIYLARSGRRNTHIANYQITKINSNLNGYPNNLWIIIVIQPAQHKHRPHRPLPVATHHHRIMHIAQAQPLKHKHNLPSLPVPINLHIGTIFDGPRIDHLLPWCNKLAAQVDVPILEIIRIKLEPHLEEAPIGVPMVE